MEELCTSSTGPTFQHTTGIDVIGEGSGSNTTTITTTAASPGGAASSTSAKLNILAHPDSKLPSITDINDDGTLKNKIVSNKSK